MAGPLPPESAPPGGSSAPGGDAPPEKQGGGGASKLVTDIHSGLMQLMDMMGSAPGIDDGAKQKLAALIQGFQELVSELGGPQGGKPQGPPGVAPAEAGAGDVQQAL